MTSSANGQESDRLEAVRAKLDEWQVDGVLIGSPSNRRWLSGFSGSAGWLLVTRDKALLGTDFRYWEQAADQAPSFELVKLEGMPAQSLPPFIASVGARRFGLEAKHITLDQFKTLEKADGVEWVQLENSLEALRAVKTAEELDAIRRAAAITDFAMSLVPALARPDMSEKELAWQLEKAMREQGASSMAFEIIVAAGPNGARAHHQPGPRPLAAGDPIIVDMGAELDGYSSDLTRTFYLGSEPDERFREIYATVQQAEQAALGVMRAGMNGKEIDALARDLIAAAGYKENFGHSLGHGVGLQVHEEPRLSHLADEEPLPAGAVVTVEPGIYISGWGGVRLEDLTLLTADGVELLSHAPQEPAIPF
ncbi:MAG: M24 family metallopeptidase [Candidatus Promineifilaceae bacterium]